MRRELLFIYENSKPLDVASLFHGFYRDVGPVAYDGRVFGHHCLDLEDGAFGNQIVGEVTFTEHGGLEVRR